MTKRHDVSGLPDPRLAAIVDSADDPIIGKDLKGRVFAWNQAAEHLFGYTAEEMIGQPLTIIFPPDRLQEEESILGAVARGDRVEHYETTRVCKDGRIIRIAATVVPIRDASGQIMGASKIVRDLTERDAHRQRIEELQVEFAHAQRLTELGQVVSKLVHEISQPITAIRNYVNGCRRLAASGNQAGIKTALDQAGTQIDRTSEIVQRIRDYVKKREAQMQPEKVSSVIHEAIELTRSSFRGQELGFTVRVEPANQGAVIDRIQVQQVFFNLMRNSVEAMSDQSRRELAITALATRHGMVEIGVADTGTGLPDAVRKQLFQPFVTTKPNGMGIGLSVCQGVVELYGGRLWADDNIGGGTVFRFTVKGAEIAATAR